MREREREREIPVLADSRSINEASTQLGRQGPIRQTQYQLPYKHLDHAFLIEEV